MDRSRPWDGRNGALKSLKPLLKRLLDALPTFPPLSALPSPTPGSADAAAPAVAIKKSHETPEAAASRQAALRCWQGGLVPFRPHGAYHLDDWTRNLRRRAQIEGGGASLFARDTGATLAAVSGGGVISASLCWGKADPVKKRKRVRYDQ